MSAVTSPDDKLVAQCADAGDIARAVRGIVALRDDDAIAQSVAYFDTAEKIEALEAELLQYEQAEIPVTHRICEGVYAREITIPRGTFAIGHAHRHDCINIVMSGSASVLVDGHIKRISGPCVFIGKALERKVGYIHEDATWITVHNTSETDIARIEEQLLIKSAAYRAFEQRLKDGEVARRILPSPERSDYIDLTSSIGMTDERIRAQVESTSDVIQLPKPFDEAVEFRSSPIHGIGSFSRRALKPYEFVAPARIGSMRTTVGRYTNHSPSPNCLMVPKENGDIILVANEPISAGTELTVNYRDAIAAARSIKNPPCQQ